MIYAEEGGVLTKHKGLHLTPTAAMRPATPRPLSRPLPRPVARRPTRAMASSSSPAVEIWVKGDPKTQTLLDCE